jgi:hypothetical protein
LPSGVSCWSFHFLLVAETLRKRSRMVPIPASGS